MAGVSCGAHRDVMLILYRELIRSVLEFGYIAFDRMAATHMLKLEAEWVPILLKSIDKVSKIKIKQSVSQRWNPTLNP
jgi:hypothetical protein